MEKHVGFQQLGLTLYDIHQCLTKDFYLQIPPALLAKTTLTTVSKNMPQINAYSINEPRLISYDERKDVFANYYKQENVQTLFQLSQPSNYPTGHPPYAQQLEQSNVHNASNFEYAQKVTETHPTTDTQYVDPKKKILCI